MTKSGRFEFFDTYRGFALLIMAVYHFAFDLNSFGVIRADMNHSEFWLNFRAFIMTSFLGLVGISFSLGHIGYHDRRYQKRLALIAGCAGLISASTFIINSSSWIFFGVLHLIFVASLVAPLVARWPRTCLAIGIALTVLPSLYRDIWFSRTGFVILGLSPVKPVTEDFAPFAPWFGVILIGVFVGRVVQSKNSRWAHRVPSPTLAFLGRHSLLFYMTHQLVLFPLAWLISKA